MPKHFLLPLSALAIALAPPPSLHGAVVTLNPVADTFVATGPTNNLVANNYGGAGALALSAAGLSNGEFQAVLSFDTSSAKNTFDGLYGPGGWTVQSVTLALTATPTNNAIFNANTGGSFGVSWMQNDGWTEGTGSPNAPGATGLNYTSLQGLINPAADEGLGTFNYDGSSSSTSTSPLSLPPGFTAELLAGNPISLRTSAADGTVSSPIQLTFRHHRGQPTGPHHLGGARTGPHRPPGPRRVAGPGPGRPQPAPLTPGSP